MKASQKTMLLYSYVFSHHAEGATDILRKHEIWFNLTSVLPFSGEKGKTFSLLDVLYKNFYAFNLYIRPQDFQLVKELIEDADKKLAHRFKGNIFHSYENSELIEIASNPQEWGFFYSELAKIQIIKRKESDTIEKIEANYAEKFQSMKSLNGDSIYDNTKLIAYMFAIVIAFGTLINFINSGYHR